MSGAWPMIDPVTIVVKINYFFEIKVNICLNGEQNRGVAFLPEHCASLCLVQAARPRQQQQRWWPWQTTTTDVCPFMLLPPRRRNLSDLLWKCFEGSAIDIGPFHWLTVQLPLPLKHCWSPTRSVRGFAGTSPQTLRLRCQLIFSARFLPLLIDTKLPIVCRFSFSIPKAQPLYFCRLSEGNKAESWGKRRRTIGMMPPKWL